VAEFLENFIHLLPYWYFLNRAFGLGNAEENHSDAFDTDLNNSENHDSRTLDAQRLNYNSLLFYESLKQQLQAQVSSLFRYVLIFMAFGVLICH